MDDLVLVKHAKGAPGLRLLGLGPKFYPLRGINQLQNLMIQNTFWANNRTHRDIRKMLRASSVVISAWNGKNIIGFGRATTDEIYRAVLWDIVVDKNYQKKGLGKAIVEKILLDPLLSEVEKIYLMTTNFEVFYSKMGFIKEDKKTLMVLKNKHF
jgi:N-acetylglutamate synthase-like GNAT family acetyltransferase